MQSLVAHKTRDPINKVTICFVWPCFSDLVVLSTTIGYELFFNKLLFPINKGPTLHERLRNIQAQNAKRVVG